jgi:ABC-type cobalamin/Fe3+-siderophores transport system ATPase subunit
VLLPLLVTMTLPSAWSALTVARRRYESIHAWVQHARAGRLLGSLLIEPEAAPEIRVHGVGGFLLRHFRAMSETAEAEQARLARLAARTGLIAAALIVDEPTAALDARAELEVFDTIRALADSGQTVVLITHRLASVRHADLVHVLDQGRLVESGTPEELLAAGGVYAELYSLQAEQFQKAPVPAAEAD